jgi:imidazolonepropionase-like amidohydrolase
MILAASLGVTPVISRSAQASRPLALVGGTLIDGFGAPPIRNSVVLVQGERISAVGQVGTLPVPPGAEVISTEGMTVLPGLWDMHVHLMINGHSDYAHWDKTYPARFEKEIMPASALQLLKAGVTSARDLGGPLEASLNVRDAINRGDPRAHREDGARAVLLDADRAGTLQLRLHARQPGNARRPVLERGPAAGHRR